jgi:long-chain acyl-CoA synthetase
MSGGATVSGTTTPGGPGYADRPWLSSYQTGVPPEIEVPDGTLSRLLDDAAAEFPDRPVVSFLGRTLTYGELLRDVNAFAGGLKRLGVSVGDRVCLLLPNCPQHVIAFYAALRLGAIVAEANPLYTEAELTHQLADCGATYVVCLDRTFAAVEKSRASGRTAVSEVVVTAIPDYLTRKDQFLLKLPIPPARRRRAEIVTDLPRGARAWGFLDVLASGRATPVTASVPGTATDIAVLLYTTGTTGAAKGAMLTHRNLLANAEQCTAWDPGMRRGAEVGLGVLPMFHAYGMTLGLAEAMLAASHLVLVPRFDIDMVLEAIRRHRPTVFPGVPPMYQALLNDPRTATVDLRSIRACVSGAMKLPAELQRRWAEATGDPVVEGYGMTEASPVTHCGPLNGNVRPGWIGLPLPSTDCRIVDLDDPSLDVPVGESGELAVRGPQVFAGYWNNDEATKQTLTDEGWLLTGDVARMDAEGWFEIVDRKKELIIASGFNVYPNEVEEVLAAMPQVAQVAVIGVPDAYRGETVKAFIVTRDGTSLTEDEVKTFSRERLAAYKVPTLIEFRDTPLPTVGIGKVLRRQLRAEERAKAGGAG